MNDKIKYNFFKIIVCLFVLIITIFALKKPVFAQDSNNLGLSINTTYTNSVNFDPIINNAILSMQDTDNEDDEDDEDDTSNNGSEEEENEIDIDEVDDKGFPVWKIVSEDYYETPYRRFEIIFLASFSYIFFLNITLVSTITQIVPADYGENLQYNEFNSSLVYYSFLSSIILSLSVAIEDFRVVYIEGISKNNDKNNSNSDTMNDGFTFYFAPKLFLTKEAICFRLFIINF